MTTDVDKVLHSVVAPLRDVLKELNAEEGELKGRLDEVRAKRNGVERTLRGLGEEVPARYPAQRKKRAASLNGAAGSSTASAVIVEEVRAVMRKLTPNVTIHDLMDNGLAHRHETSVRDAVNVMRANEDVRLTGKRGKSNTYTLMNGGK